MLKGLVFVLAALILCKHALCKQKDDWWDNLGRFMTEKTEGLKGFVTGVRCPYNYNADTIMDHVKSRIGGQDYALDRLEKALRVHEDRSTTMERRPLVLVLAGPSGLGKTELATTLGDVMLARKKRINNRIGAPVESLGFLKIDGTSLRTREQVQRERKRILKLLSSCNGHGLIRVDEAQSMSEEALNMFSSLISPPYTVSDPDDFISTSSTHDAIFIFVYASIMEKEFQKMLLEAVAKASRQESTSSEGVTKRPSIEYLSYRKIHDATITKLDEIWLEAENSHAGDSTEASNSLDSSNVVQEVEEEEVEEEEDSKETKVSATHFGKHVSTVIPFLPFTPSELMEIMALKIAQESTNQEGARWKKLVVKDPEVVRMFVEKDGVTYHQYYAPSNKKVSIVLSKNGARDIRDEALSAFQRFLLNAKPFRSDAILMISMERGKKLGLWWCDVNTKLISKSHHEGEVTSHDKLEKELLKDVYPPYHPLYKDCGEQNKQTCTVHSPQALTDRCELVYQGDLDL